jgi:hypothetical protein
MSAELTRSIQLGAWTSLGAIAYATLTHVGFAHSVYLSLSPVLMRPEMRAYVLVEHVGAFALFGAMFSFAYPRRTLERDGASLNRLGIPICGTTPRSRALFNSTPYGAVRPYVRPLVADLWPAGLDDVRDMTGQPNQRAR